MKSIAKAAFVAVLLAGTGGVIATAPAAAKDKKEEKKPGLKLSPDVVKVAQPAQTALAAKDTATAEPLIAQAEAAAKTDDDKYITAALRLQLESTKIFAAPGGPTPQTEQVLKAPLEALIASPSTPPADKPRYIYQRGVIANDARDFATAAKYFEQAQAAGYQDPNMAMQIVKAKMGAGDVAGGNAALDKAIQAQTANGGKADEQLYRYAIAQSNQKKMNAETIVWLKKWVAAYPTAKNWRDALVVYGLQPTSVAPGLDKAQKVDLFRLMRATKSLADQYDYENYAQWVFDLGLPFEAKAVLTEGKAAGKIPASSASATGLLTAANNSIKNEGSLAPLEAKAQAAANGKLAASTADAYLGSADYAKAIALYRTALQKGGVNADEVNTHLGIALAMSGDKAGAKTAFQAVTTAPRSDIAGFWTAYIDAPPAA